MPINISSTLFPNLPVIECKNRVTGPTGKPTLNHGLKGLPDRGLRGRFGNLLLGCLNLDGDATLNFRLALCRISFTHLH